MILLSSEPQWVDILCADIYKTTLNKLLVNNAIQDALSSGSGSLAGTILNDSVKLVGDNIIPPMQGLAISIATLFFFISFTELIMSERLTMEYFIKFFGKLAVSIGLILVCPELIKGCMDFGANLTNFMSTTIDFSNLGGGGSASELVWLDDTSNALAISFRMQRDAVGSNWLSLLMTTLFTAAPMQVVALGIVVICYVIAFSRILELTIRAAFMPIAVALMSDDGWKGSGGRYIKKFLALSAQSAVLFMISTACGLIITTAINYKTPGNVGSEPISNGAMLEVLLVTVAAAAASVKIMFSSIGIINDVFGV